MAIWHAYSKAPDKYSREHVDRPGDSDTGVSIFQVSRSGFPTACRHYVPQLSTILLNRMVCLRFRGLLALIRGGNMWLTTTRKRSIERILNEAGDSLLWAYAAAFWGCAIFGWPVHDVRLGVTIGPLILFVYRVALLIADKKNPKAFAYTSSQRLSTLSGGISLQKFC
jgi:hypothetical protein